MTYFKAIRPKHWVVERCAINALMKPWRVIEP